MRFAIDGHEIDYEVRGEGRTVIVLHGLTTDRRILAATCDPLLAAAGLRRVYLDLPGHGLSLGNPAYATADGLVDALAALVTAVIQPTVTEPPLLIAYAYGGYLAQGLVGLVDLGGLFLLCPVVEPDFGKRTTPPKQVLVSDGELPFSDDPREREAFLEVAVVQTAPLLARFQELVHPANIAVDPTFVATLRSRYGLARPLLPGLNAFTRPAAIVCGRHDHWVGFVDGARLAAQLPRASFAALRSLVRSHGGELEKRAWLADEITALLQRLGVDPRRLHGLVFAPLGERTMGLCPGEFFALVARRPV